MPNPVHVTAEPGATRRGMIGGIGALLLTAAAAPPPKATGPDAALLACCAEAMASNAASDRLWTVCLALPDAVPFAPPHPAFVAYEAHEDATLGRWLSLLDRIGTLPGHTPVGLRAKVAVARSAVPAERREDANPADTLAWSLFDDIMRSALA